MSEASVGTSAGRVPYSAPVLRDVGSLAEITSGLDNVFPDPTDSPTYGSTATPAS